MCQRPLSLAVLCFVFALGLGCFYSAAAQTIPENTEFAVEISPVPLSKDVIAVTLKWQTPAPDSREFAMLFQANVRSGIYYIVRVCEEGIVAFGYSKDVITFAVKKGVRVSHLTTVDYDKPYVMREDLKEVVIIQDDTATIKKVFAALNEFFYKSVLPNMFGIPQQTTKPFKSILGNAIMFKQEREWLWFSKDLSLIA